MQKHGKVYTSCILFTLYELVAHLICSLGYIQFVLMCIFMWSHGYVVTCLHSHEITWLHSHVVAVVRKNLTLLFSVKVWLLALMIESLFVRVVIIYY